MDWFYIDDSHEAAKVPGGVVLRYNGGYGFAMCFIPNVRLVRDETQAAWVYRIVALT